MGQMTVFSGPERRRRWSEEERGRILTEAFSPGACVASVARRHDVSTGLIYTWRRNLCAARAEAASPDLPGPAFAEAMVQEGAGSGPPSPTPAITIDLTRGRRVSIFQSASPAVVAVVLKALR